MGRRHADALPTTAGPDNPRHRPDGARRSWVPCRVDCSVLTVGTEQVHRPFRVASVEGWSAATHRPLHRDSRVAAWLAIPRVFLSRIPLSGRGVDPSCPADQAHLRSHSGAGAGDVLVGAPTGPEYTVELQSFGTLLLERMRLPVDVTDSNLDTTAPSSVPTIRETSNERART